MALQVLFLLTSTTSFAGSCMDGEEAYKKCIENPKTACLYNQEPMMEYNADGEYVELAPSLERNLKYALECYPLQIWNQSPPDLNPERYLDEAVLARLEERRNDKTMKQWVVEYVTPLIREYSQVRCRAAFQLAPYRHAEAFAILKECDDAWGLAILGDERALDYFIDYFKKYDAMYKSKPVFSLGYKKFSIGAMVIINSKKAISFLNEQLGNSRNKDLIADIKWVIQKIQGQTKK